MKCFRKPRPIDPALAENLCAMGEDGALLAKTLEGALPAVSLTSHLSLSTAYANDRAPEVVFAQQLSGLATRGDTLICISTSGNSRNCVLAATVGRAMGLSIIALTGAKESRLSALSDVTLYAPSTETYRIQEYHLPIYHALCAMLEEELF
jgi:D-sedoheptulose 7-phosphate isomerase